MAKSEEYVVKLIESVAVIKVSVGVKRAELVISHQDHDVHLQPMYQVSQDFKFHYY